MSTERERWWCWLDNSSSRHKSRKGMLSARHSCIFLILCATIFMKQDWKRCNPTSTESSTKSGASRYSGSTVGQGCCRTPPLCWREALSGFLTWHRPERDTCENGSVMSNIWCSLLDFWKQTSFCYLCMWVQNLLLSNYWAVCVSPTCPKFRSQVRGHRCRHLNQCS